jgi:hypothetical protein
VATDRDTGRSRRFNFRMASTGEANTAISVERQTGRSSIRVEISSSAAGRWTLVEAGGGGAVVAAGGNAKADRR